VCPHAPLGYPTGASRPIQGRIQKFLTGAVLEKKILRSFLLVQSHEKNSEDFLLVPTLKSQSFLTVTIFLDNLWFQFFCSQVLKKTDFFGCF